MRSAGRLGGNVVHVVGKPDTRMKMSKLVFFDVFSQLPGLAHVRKVKTSSCRSSILRSEMTTISKT